MPNLSNQRILVRQTIAKLKDGKTVCHSEYDYEDPAYKASKGAPVFKCESTTTVFSAFQEFASIFQANNMLVPGILGYEEQQGDKTLHYALCPVLGQRFTSDRYLLRADALQDAASQGLNFLKSHPLYESAKLNPKPVVRQNIHLPEYLDQLTKTNGFYISPILNVVEDILTANGCSPQMIIDILPAAPAADDVGTSIYRSEVHIKDLRIEMEGNFQTAQEARNAFAKEIYKSLQRHGAGLSEGFQSSIIRDALLDLCFHAFYYDQPEERLLKQVPLTCETVITEE